MSKLGTEHNRLMNRREAMLLSATAGAGAALCRPAQAMDAIKSSVPLEAGNCSTPRSAVAKTQYGRARGFVDGGVFTFKGVPYGQNTGGENRWLPAKPPVPWRDDYPALVYGGNCLQFHHGWTEIEQTFLQDWDDGYQSEDMLKLNIWTPSLTGSRPVMFYIHGGGFSTGSSYELPAHEGAQMARHHDVVQVSVNHRLNGLGFLDLSEVGGTAYEDSVNVGMTDLIAALRWVQENIANFGGDPNKVMIYGQSGGGSKVTTLLCMPAAKGMIHRASVQSGGGGNYPSAEESKEFSRRVIKRLGIAPNDIAALQKMEWSKINAAGNAVAGEMSPMLGGPNLIFVPEGPDSERRVGWGPTLDIRNIPIRSFTEEAPEITKDVPMMMGSVSEENMQFRFKADEALWMSALTPMIGADKSSRLLEAMKKAYPEKNVRTLFYHVGGLGGRNHVQRMARLRHELNGSAPVYQYYFKWQTPMLDGVGGAWHTAELAFCFDNVKRCEQGTGNTPEAQALAKKMATAWANFARNGNPSQPGLTWTATDPRRCQTMVFDNECGMVDDPEGSLRKILLD